MKRQKTEKLREGKNEQSNPETENDLTLNDKTDSTELQMIK